MIKRIGTIIICILLIATCLVIVLPVGNLNASVNELTIDKVGILPYNWKGNFDDGTIFNQQNLKNISPIQNLYNVNITVTDSAQGQGRTLGSDSDDTKVLSEHNYSKKYALIVVGKTYNDNESNNLNDGADDMGNLLQSYGFNIIRYCCPSITDFSGALSSIGKKVKHNDLFVLLLLGHGSNKDGQTYFQLNNEQSPYDEVWDYNLGSWLDSIDCEQIILIQCCHSGGFINDISKESWDDHRIICTACKEDENYGFLPYNWEKGWIQTFVKGLSGSADYNRDRFYSIEEAFRYSSIAFTYNKQHPLLDDNCDDEGHNHLDDGYTRGLESGKDGFYSASVSLNSGPKYKSYYFFISSIFQFFKKLIHHFPIYENMLNQILI